MKKVTKSLFAVLSIVFCLSVTGNAQDDTESTGLGLKGIGGQIGYVSPTNLDGAVSFSAVLNLGNYSNDIKIYPAITYWKSSFDYADFGLGSYSIDVIQLSFQINGRYYLDSESKYYAGTGVGLYAHNYTFIDESGNEYDLGLYANSIDFGANFFAGIEMPISSGFELFGEAKYTVVSDWGTYGISGGLIFSL